MSEERRLLSPMIAVNFLIGVGDHAGSVGAVQLLIPMSEAERCGNMSSGDVKRASKVFAATLQNVVDNIRKNRETKK